MMDEPSEFEKEYSNAGFWRKLTGYARSAGIEVIEKALLLYYALQEDATPAWAKTTIIGALGYFITLIDAIPDITPAVGYADDLGVLVLAIAATSMYINENVKDKTREKLVEWFGDNDAELS
ncbi:MAG: YkvA family protein [Congregibacter sp.]